MIKFLTLLVVVAGCFERKPKKYNVSLESARQKLAFYVSETKDIYNTMNRCDGLTFAGMWDAFAKHVDIYGHEYEPGQWHRDRRPCYPNDSRSEISTEGLFGAMIAMIRRGDYDKISDLRSYLADHDWVAGDGPEEYTRVLQLGPLIKEILEKNWRLGRDQHRVLRYAAVSDDDDASLGYRGNVLAYYIAVHHVGLGYLKSWHVAAAEQLASELPQSPFYQALAGCYGDDGYQTALNLLGNEELFPSDRLPAPSNEGLWDWSDAPQLPVFAMSVGILESCHE